MDRDDLEALAGIATFATTARLLIKVAREGLGGIAPGGRRVGRRPSPLAPSLSGPGQPRQGRIRPRPRPPAPSLPPGVRAPAATAPTTDISARRRASDCLSSGPDPG